MKTFVMGDIHGAYQALLECLKQANFDKSRDRLICLGDVCDRGPQVKQCIDELLSIPQCIYILGNHDAWTLDWAVYGKAPQDWLDQGGFHTVSSYQATGLPQDHIQFLTEARLYFVDENKLYVHGGFDPGTSLADTSKQVFLWDRNLLQKAREFHQICPEWKYGDYDEIYIGHNPTIRFGKSEPQKFCNIWAMDTGAGWGAKLSIMDVDSKEFWQADVN